VTRNQRVGSLTRRETLGAIGIAAAAVGMPGSAAGGTSNGRDYYLRQGDRCLELEPLPGEEPVTELYNWDEGETDFSSAGTTTIQRPDTSILFLYEDQDGNVSLVFVHGKLGGDHDGGSVSFSFVDLPESGSWQVQDDKYGGDANYDVWQTGGTDQSVDWTWTGGRTDGGTFGPLGDEFAIRIEPAFNEAAALFGQYYDGRVTDWEALSGDRFDPDRHELALDEPITLGTGRCRDDEEEREDEDDEREREREDDEREEDDDDERGPPADAGPPEDAGPPDDAGQPDHAGAPEHAGPPDDDEDEDDDEDDD